MAEKPPFDVHDSGRLPREKLSRVLFGWEQRPAQRRSQDTDDNSLRVCFVSRVGARETRLRRRSRTPDKSAQGQEP